MYIIKLLKSMLRYNILIAFLLFIVLLLSIGFHTLYKNAGILPWAKNQYFAIDLMTNNVSEFFNQESSLEKLIHFYEDYNNRWRASYYVKSGQPLFIDENPFPIIFTYGYDDFLPTEVDPNTFSAYQLNQAAITGFELTLYKGDLFSASDFIFNEQSILPVIMGYDYKDIVAIGDVFRGNYLNIDFDCYVLGILEEDNKIMYDLSLNRCIVLPALEADPYIHYDEKTTLFLKKMYLNYTNGLIVTEEKPMTIQRFLDDAVKKYDLPFYILLAMPKIYIGNMGVANSLLFLQIVVSLFSFILIALCGLLYGKKIKSVLKQHPSYHNTRNKFIISMYMDVLIWIALIAFIVHSALSFFCSRIGLPFSLDLFFTFMISGIAWMLIPLFAVFRLLRRQS